MTDFEELCAATRHNNSFKVRALLDSGCRVNPTREEESAPQPLSHPCPFYLAIAHRFFPPDSDGEFTAKRYNFGKPDIQYGVEREYFAHANDPQYGLDSNKKILQLLVENGVKQSWRNTLDERPVHIAAKHDNVYALQTVLGWDSTDLNSTNWERQTPLHLAAKVGALNAAKFLRDAGAILSERNEDGKTPFELALDNSHVRTAKELLIVDDELPGRLSGRTKEVFDMLLWCAWDRNTKTFEELLNHLPARNLIDIQKLAPTKERGAQRELRSRQNACLSVSIMPA